MRLLAFLIALIAWLIWLARRRSHRARIAFGLTLISLGAGYFVLLRLLLHTSGVVPIHGGRNRPPTMLEIGNDPVLWILGGLLSGGLPLILIVAGIQVIRRPGQSDAHSGDGRSDRRETGDRR
jgi:4-amino-4-deoxy-L-arabinose transferase-like glycosyltransferase